MSFDSIDPDLQFSGFPAGGVFHSVYERLTGCAETSALLIRGGAMSGHQCSSCQVERAVREVTPVTRGYAEKALECPKCKSILRLVVRHPFPRGTTFHRIDKQSAA